MNQAHLLIRITAIITAACYLGRVLLDVTGRSSPGVNRAKFSLWIGGCGMLWVHMFAAFHGFHNWNHAHTVEHTAKQTAAVTGWFWGGGIYFNYVFAVFWTWDVWRWWKHGEPAGRQFWVAHTVFAIMMVNATVVFGPAYWWWILAAFCGSVVLIKTFRRAEW